eukprot:CAMPEP_0202695448 /NCGR_PEP_ID=MMETSP1385-20130828/9036_1 /ASSEMBLY_ACC=CAM_ASM_000861 /TAXON_ID=933848 /ORGANISM="Elphidium margaritaceum" /LENGTH=484 /DNA_ID=CAMNT_0049351471 /DNA_START=233 /DNA_END=1688 /DNA_ORIENTATION=-
MDNSFVAEFKFKHGHNSASGGGNDYMIKVYGLSANTRFRLQVRCKLLYCDEMMHAAWSSAVTVQTKPSMVTVVTDSNNAYDPNNASQIAALQHTVAALEEKCARLQSEKNALEQKVRSLSPAHFDWDHRKIVQWMMSIQGGKLKAYKSTLSESLKTEGVCGEHLCQLTVDDLHRFGVTSFIDKKTLMAHLSRLTENDPRPSIAFDHKLSQEIKTPASMTSGYDAQDETRTETVMVDTSGTRRYAPPTPTLPKPQPPPYQQHQKQEQRKQEHEQERTSTVDASDSKQQQMEGKESHGTLSLKDVHSSAGGMNSTALAGYTVTDSLRNLLLTSPSNSVPKTWRYKDGVLTVKVMKATDLDNMDGAGEESDPFVELEMAGMYKKEKTKTFYNEPNPVWNQLFQLFCDNPKKAVLKCTVWDYDRWSWKNDKIGKVEIPVIDVLNANGLLMKQEGFDIEGSKCGAKLFLELAIKNMLVEIDRKQLHKRI